MIGWKGFRMHEEAQCAPPRHMDTREQIPHATNCNYCWPGWFKTGTLTFLMYLGHHCLPKLVQQEGS